MNEDDILAVGLAAAFLIAGFSLIGAVVSFLI